MSVLLSVKIPTTLCVINSEKTRGAARPSPNSIGNMICQHRKTKK